MAKITLEGSRQTPSTYLAAGKRITVDRTPMVDKMIRKGYVRVIEEGTTVSAAQHVIEIVEEQQAAVDSERQLAGTPARNASRDEWAQFLRDEGVPFDESAARNDLILTWDSYFPVDAEVVDDGGTDD